MTSESRYSGRFSQHEPRAPRPDSRDDLRGRHSQSIQNRDSFSSDSFSRVDSRKDRSNHGRVPKDLDNMTAFEGGKEEGETRKNKCRTALVRIGESNKKSIEEYIKNVVGVLDAETEMEQVVIMKLLMDCVLKQAGKISIYAAVVGLYVIGHVEFGDAFAEMVNEELAGALKELDFLKLRLLIRFAGECVANSFVNAISWFGVVKSLVQIAVELNTVGNIQSIYLSDALVYSVLSAIPFVGEFLSFTFDAEFKELMNSIASFMSSRKFRGNDLLIARNDVKPDALKELFDAIMQNPKFSSQVLFSPWKHFQGAYLHAKSNLHSFQWEPSQLEEFVSALRCLINGPPSSPGIQKAKLALPAPSFRFFNSSYSDLDRWIIAEMMIDLLNAMVDHSSIAMKLLFTLPVIGNVSDYRHIIVESLVAEMFRLPYSAQKQLYYMHVLIDAFQEQPKDMPPLVGRTIHNLFEQLQDLDTACRNRLVKWFSTHISNFAFAWPWKNWQEIVSLPNDHIRVWFVRSALAECVMLSFRDRLLKSLPATFEPYLLVNATHTYRYVIPPNSIPSDPASIAAAELSSLLMASLTPSALITWIEKQILPTEVVVDICIQSILYITSTSVMQSLALLEKYKEVFRKPDYRPLVVKAITDFWKLSLSHLKILLNKSLALNIVDSLSISKWVIEDVASVPKWELLESIGSIVNRRLETVQNALLKEQDPSHLEKLKTALKIASAEHKNYYVFVISRLALRYLSSTPVYTWALGRLKQFARENVHHLLALIPDILAEIRSLDLMSNASIEDVKNVLASLSFV